MNASLRNLFTFVRLSSGRRLHVFREMRKRALARGLADVVAHLDRAIAHEKHIRKLNRRWRAQGRPRMFASADIGHIDKLTDQSLSGFRDVVAGYTRGALPGDVKAAHAQRIIDAVFPDGVAAITTLPFVEQLAALELVLEMLASELSVEVAELGLAHLVARLTTLHGMYQSALAQSSDQILFRDVKAARDRGHAFELEAVSLVLGRFFREDDETHVQARAELLEPLLAQDQAMRDYTRARRSDSGADVDADIDVDDDADADIDIDADADGDADAQDAGAAVETSAPASTDV